jgi:hypothetical protein
MSVNSIETLGKRIQPTRERISDPGRPLSLANAHVILEAVVRYPIVAEAKAAIRIADLQSKHLLLKNGIIVRTIAEAAPADPVASTKISIYGNLVAEFKAVRTSPKQKSAAMRMAMPNTPFNSTEMIMLLGITCDAPSISSAVNVHCQQREPILRCDLLNLRLTHVACSIRACQLIRISGTKRFELVTYRQTDTLL